MVVEVRNLLHVALLEQAGAKRVDIISGHRLATFVLDMEGADMKMVADGLRDFAEEFEGMPMDGDVNSLERWYKNSFMGTLDRDYRDLKGEIQDRKRTQRSG